MFSSFARVVLDGDGDCSGAASSQICQSARNRGTKACKTYVRLQIYSRTLHPVLDCKPSFHGFNALGIPIYCALRRTLVRGSTNCLVPDAIRLESLFLLVFYKLWYKRKHPPTGYPLCKQKYIFISLLFLTRSMPTVFRQTSKTAKRQNGKTEIYSCVDRMQMLLRKMDFTNHKAREHRAKTEKEPEKNRYNQRR